MQNDSMKVAVMAAWVLAGGAFGYMFGTTSFTGWALLAVVSVVPPVLTARLWRAPAPSTSEAIREALR